MAHKSIKADLLDPKEKDRVFLWLDDRNGCAYMNNQEDMIYMQTALDLARLARGKTSPNPMVGAVVVRDGRIVGQGYHKKAGTEHAEILALREAGEEARGADIYITLEPCSHTGKTPPCAPALVEAGIKRAVIACLDPNPEVAGQGEKILRERGVQTEVGLLQDEAQKLNEVFFKYIQTRTPFMVLKTAMTLDGKIAAVSGDSRWITGEASRKLVHQMRNTYDAIMAGIGTVLADDPRLNTRLEEGGQRDPVRIIVDGALDLPLDSQIARSSTEQETIILTSLIRNRKQAGALEERGIKIIELGGSPEQVPVEQALPLLGEMGICSILVEGGAALNAYLLGQRVIDKVCWFIAPKLIGGKNAPSPVAGPGIELMRDAVELDDIQYQQLERDILITGYTRW